MSYPKVIIGLFITLMGLNHLYALPITTDYPNISVVTQLLGQQQPNHTTFGADSMVLSFQNQLSPFISADVVTRMEKKKEGGYAFFIKEAYLTLPDLYRLFISPYSQEKSNLGAIVGKQLLSIGRLNHQYLEDWFFVDRPATLQHFFGEKAGLSAEGGQLVYTLPLPFFSEIEVGYWLDPRHGHNLSDNPHAVAYSNRLLNARVWSGFPLSDSQELEVGLSYLLGHSSQQLSDDQQLIIGMDVGYAWDINAKQFLLLETEIYHAMYADTNQSRANQMAGFISSVYQFHPLHRIGIRFDTIGQHNNHGETAQWSFMLSRKLAETAQLRLQYNTGPHVENSVLVQFVFGMGPRSQSLQ